MTQLSIEILRGIPRIDEPVTSTEQLDKLIAAGSVICTERELAQVVAKIYELIEEQRGNIQAKQDALQQSTEHMGHDDAGQEAAELAGKLTAGRGDALRHILKHALIVPTPPTDSPIIGIGSQFTTDETERFALVGAPNARLIDRAYAPDVFAVSYETAMGRAALGGSQGDTLTYSVNGRVFESMISTVDQPATGPQSA